MVLTLHLVSKSVRKTGEGDKSCRKAGVKLNKHGNETKRKDKGSVISGTDAATRRARGAGRRRSRTSMRSNPWRWFRCFQELRQTGTVRETCSLWRTGAEEGDRICKGRGLVSLGRGGIQGAITVLCYSWCINVHLWVSRRAQRVLLVFANLCQAKVASVTVVLSVSTVRAHLYFRKKPAVKHFMSSWETWVISWQLLLQVPPSSPPFVF